MNSSKLLKLKLNDPVLMFDGKIVADGLKLFVTTCKSPANLTCDDLQNELVKVDGCFG